MKIVTSRANDLARAVDVVDRDVINQVELTQQAPFPLPAIPAPPDVWGVATGQTATSTFGVSKADTLSDGVETAYSIIVLARGLWHISVSGSYGSGAVSSGNGFRLTLRNPQLVEVPIIWILPDGSPPNDLFQRDLTFLLPTNGWELRAILGATGLGNSHQYSVSLIGLKYL